LDTISIPAVWPVLVWYRQLVVGILIDIFGTSSFGRNSFFEDLAGTSFLNNFAGCHFFLKRGAG
jgi:hypothetical protein